ncbi:hypothetical protein B9T31_02335 [Acinetobacter sp. ANC 4558]|uniref:hypothetical protein n=1 Tax=Acinetobacter sp. ANC 4558 TaxID=1977876 RepID=UPI000A33250A|nr:hypothetical protein [Acinetobacter sp. ANC 4558]OTG88369.1 hypothetical protein B9T31_02335 [Acinetobacter sp. ANC 4558]
MSDSQQKTKVPNLLLTTILIVIETIFSFIVKHDRVIALQAKKFIDNKVSIKINSYIPYFDIYLQFDTHGILFDVNPPNDPVDLEVRTTLMDLIQILFFSNRRSIRAMRISGDSILKDEFRDLILSFSIAHIFSDWKQWLKTSVDNESLISSQKRITPLLDKINQQRSKINTLEIEIKQYKNRIRRMRRNQKSLNYTYIAVIILLSLLLVYNLCT